MPATLLSIPFILRGGSGPPTGTTSLSGVLRVELQGSNPNKHRFVLIAIDVCWSGRRGPWRFARKRIKSFTHLSGIFPLHTTLSPLALHWYPRSRLSFISNKLYLHFRYCNMSYLRTGVTRNLRPTIASQHPDATTSAHRKILLSTRNSSPVKNSSTTRPPIPWMRRGIIHHSLSCSITYLTLYRFTTSFSPYTTTLSRLSFHF